MEIKVGSARLFGDKEDRDIILCRRRTSKLRKDFCLAMDDGIMMLYKMNLTKHEYRVMLFLIANMEFENYIYLTQIYIAENLKIKQPDVSKALKVLESNGLIFKEKMDRGKVIRVSSVIAWRGRPDSKFNQRFSMDSEHLLIELND
jgi:DNA-binding MarR family transcriptional regulator